MIIRIDTQFGISLNELDKKLKLGKDIEVVDFTGDGESFHYTFKLLSRRALEYFGKIERKEKKPQRRKRSKREKLIW